MSKQKNQKARDPRTGRNLEGSAPIAGQNRKIGRASCRERVSA